MLRWAKPLVVEKLRPGSHGVLEASAGTGKTFALEHLVVDRVLSGTAIEEILVVTFTEAATAEIRDRIRDLLERLFDCSEREAAREAIEAPVPPATPDTLVSSGTPNAMPQVPELRPNQPYWELDLVGRQRIRKALFSFDSARIFTINGFCKHTLQEHAFARGGRFDEEHVDRRTLFRQAFESAFSAGFVANETIRRQAEAALQLSSKEGSWKSQAAGQKASAIESLFDTFNNLHEAEQRGASLESLQTPLRLALQNIPKGLLAKDNILASIDQLRALAEQNPLPVNRVDEIVTELLEDAAIPSSTAKALGPVQQAIEAARLHALYRIVANNYDEEKSRLGLMDYADQIARLDEALQQEAGWLEEQLDIDDPSLFLGGKRGRRAPSVPQATSQLTLLGHAASAKKTPARPLRAALRASTRVAFVDEFQDTERAQWRIFRTLFVDDPDPKLKTDLVIVGDPKQAIYGFRGADVAAYLEARKTLLALGAVRLPLVENYRSSPDLIAALNVVLDDRAPSPILSGSVRYDEPVVAAKPRLSVVDAAGRTCAAMVHFSVSDPLREGALAVGPVRNAVALAFAQELRAILGFEGDRRRLHLVDNEGKSRPLEPADVMISVASWPCFGRDGSPSAGAG